MLLIYMMVIALSTEESDIRTQKTGAGVIRSNDASVALVLVEQKG